MSGDGMGIIMKIERGPHGIIGTIKVENSELIVPYEYGVLENRQFSNLLPVSLRTMFDELELCFDITGLISLTDIDRLNWTQNEKRTALLKSLETVFSSENYYLSPEKFSYNEKNIYIDTEKKDFIWRYMPVKTNESHKSDYKDRIEQLLLSSSFLPLLTDTERTQIVHFMQKGKTEELIDFLFSIQEEKIEQDVSKTAIHPFVVLAGMYLLYLFSCLIKMQSDHMDFSNAYHEYILAFFILLYGIFIWKGKNNMPFIKKEKKAESGISKDILFPHENNTILKETNWPPYFLIELRPDAPGDLSRKAIILTDEFVLGRDPLVCDYTLDDEKLEDAHARIERFEDKLYISDMHTEHGTWVKNKRLEEPEKILLQNGDVIQLADTILLFTNGQITQIEGKNE